MFGDQWDKTENVVLNASLKPFFGVKGEEYADKRHDNGKRGEDQCYGYRFVGLKTIHFRCLHEKPFTQTNARKGQYAEHRTN